MVAMFLPVIPSLATIAYNSRPGSNERILSTVSLATYICVPAWTLLGIMPTNGVMLKIVKDKDAKLAAGARPFSVDVCRLSAAAHWNCSQKKVPN